ncbi:NADPH-dependent FMN reductase [Streptomyces marispadix]|uniref:NADPH-dependent FMN reductase n=1 Tax=Streptomyces marispadix TaxID=2922868 RepID=A0ABS9T5L1_9ACTN|nr:NADPH-dependent FMN reductase [Streptomyces marispadix]MCH6163718.1 NADPH-dependent FMN reductase [Streptomyces marispadix]
MPNVLTLSGSPSARSRTSSLVRHVGRLLTDEHHDVRHIAVRDLPPEPLLAGNAAHPAIREVVEAVDWADALVVGTPVYKAAYSGLLKTLLDLLPQFALAGKTVLPLATGGSTAHVLAIDYALRPVLTSLGTDNVLRGWFVLDRHVSPDAPETEGSGVVAAEAADGVTETVDRLLDSLAASPPAAVAARPGLAPAV